MIQSLKIQQYIDFWICFQHMFSQNHGPFPSIYIQYIYICTPTIRWMASLKSCQRMLRMNALWTLASHQPHHFSMKSPWSRQSWQVDFRYQIVDANAIYLFVFERDKHLEILAFFFEKMMVFKVIDEFVILTGYNWLLDAISESASTNQGDLDQMSSSTLCCVPRQLFNFRPSRCCWERRSDSGGSGRSVSQSHADSSWRSWS